MKFMFDLQHPLTCNPSTTLSNPCNKVRGKNIIVKEIFLCLPSCVFILRYPSCICICSCVVVMLKMFMYTTQLPYLPTPSTQVGYDSRSIFKRSLTDLNFLDQLPHQGWGPQSVLLFTHSWRENNWIHTFPKGISAMWNAISLIQDLNSCHCVHFLRR